MVGIMEYRPTAYSLQSRLLKVSDVSDGLDETHTRLDGRWNNMWVQRNYDFLEGSSIGL